MRSSRAASDAMSPSNSWRRSSWPGSDGRVRTADAPRIVVIGVRSSCDRTAMNASRHSLARRSAPTSSSRSASTTRRSVMSCPVPTIRTGCPLAS